MVTIITTIIVSVILGTLGSSMPLGINLPGKNLFSQISSINSLSEVKPLESLINVTGPIDGIWKALGRYLNVPSGPDDSLRAKSALAGRLDIKDALNRMDNVSIGRALGVAKSALILMANILVAVLEIALWALRGILGLIT